MTTMPAAESSRFAEKSLLLIEDNFLVGLSIKRQLERLGCTVTGPIASLAEAQRSLDAQPLDAAVLDINIKGGTSEPVARSLSTRGTPFLFITGFQSPFMLGEDLHDVPRLNKPIGLDELRDALTPLLLTPDS